MTTCDRVAAIYDPEEGLKTIAVAKAAEKAAIRALRLDPTDPLARRRLLKIIEVKLDGQRKYVVWRDDKMKPRRDRGAGGRGKKSSRVPAVALPAFDPGQDVADRWRKRLCIKTEDEITKLNESTISQPSPAAK